MPPQYQQILQQAQAAQQQAKFIAYSTYVAILVCAAFSILIFWKLCQIQKQLGSAPQKQSPKPYTPPMPGLASTPSQPPPKSSVPDDSRYMPKK